MPTPNFVRIAEQAAQEAQRAATIVSRRAKDSPQATRASRIAIQAAQAAQTAAQAAAQLARAAKNNQEITSQVMEAAQAFAKAAQAAAPAATMCADSIIQTPPRTRTKKKRSKRHA